MVEISNYFLNVLVFIFKLLCLGMNGGCWVVVVKTKMLFLSFVVV